MFEPLEAQLARFKEYCDSLRELARIHIDIDGPERRIASDEPDWVFRLRKVYLHVVAITDCEVSADGIHVMTTELRAVYEQMDAVWKCLPHEFRFDEDRSWWADEARKGLAEYNHPTMASLMSPLNMGGFGDVEAEVGYAQMVVWMGRFIVGYGLALGYLAQVLEAEDEINYRWASVFKDMRH